MTFEVGRKKTGGRVAGTSNHATVAHRIAILKSGLSPIDYLCSVYRDPNEPTNLRLDAARTVANFIYPRLSSVDLNSHNDQPLTVQILRFSDLPLADRRHEDRLIDVVPDAVDEADEADAA